MATIIQKFYPLSRSESFELLKKFPGCSPATVSDYAKIRGATFYEEEYENKGVWALRSSTNPNFDTSNSKIDTVHCDGKLFSLPTNTEGLGVRLGTTIALDEESKEHNKRFSALVRNRKGISENYSDIQESVVPCIYFGTKPDSSGPQEWIWLNKWECDQGIDDYIKLVSADIVDCAPPFNSAARNNNNFAYAQTFRLHYETLGDKIVKDNKDKIKILETEFTSDDKYEGGRVIIPPEYKVRRNLTKLFKRLNDNNIKETDFKEELKKLNGLNDTKEKVEMFKKTLDELMEKRKLMKEKLERINREKEEQRKKEVEALNSAIENLDL